MQNNSTTGYDFFQEIGNNLLTKKQDKDSLKEAKMTSVNCIENINYRKLKLSASNNEVSKTSSVGLILDNKFKGEAIKTNQAYRVYKSRDIVSAQQIPTQIAKLIHNPVYNNRYLFLIRQYSLDWVLKLAELVENNPEVKKKQNYFAKCCSVKQWEEQTHQMLEEVFKKIDQAKTILKEMGISVNMASKYFYYKVFLIEKLSEYQIQLIKDGLSKKWMLNPKYNKEQMFTRWALDFIKGEIPLFMKQKINNSLC